MRLHVGCVPVLIASCCGCCCCRVPTFGLGPAVDEAAIVAELRRQPLVVDQLCRTAARCEVVEDAEVEVVPVGWNPLTGTVTVLLTVEARCAPSSALHERAEPFVCAGLLGAALTEGAVELTRETLFILPVPEGEGAGGGGSDWDWD